MLYVENNLEPEDREMIEQNDKKYEKKRQWLNTFTKRAVAAILFFTLLDLQLTYILAFIGKDQIAETLSQAIATTIIPVMLGYFLKSLFETFLEKREERLSKEESETINSEEVL